ncbi:MAG: hypothetical protein KDJ26_07800 [Alphaproteobacteria bacterium]|nr:hypothetical protein [Alphaproteobacteria bacterium]
MPSGDLNSKQDVLEAIGASSIQRWEGLRRRDDGTLVDLPNDDTLVTQLNGLTRHCLTLCDAFNVEAELAKNIALAYVARQVLTGENHLLNNQDQTTKKPESEKLRDFADRLHDNDAALADACRKTADVLEGSSLVSDLVSDFLHAACQLYYVETGARALLAADKLKQDDPDKAILMILGSNALGNNYGKIHGSSPEVLESVVSKVFAGEAIDTRVRVMAMADNSELYKESVSKARGAAIPPKP